MIAARWLLVLAALSAAGPASAQFSLPNLGGITQKAKTVKAVSDALKGIPEQQEIELGHDLAAILLGAAPLADNAAAQHYLARVGAWLALHSERPNLPWRFAIVQSNDFNAFSTPGGTVFITTGLFERMRSESELAGVLSHEIAHVVARHHLKALQKSLGQTALADVSQYYSGPRGPGGLAGDFTSRLLASGKELFIHGLDQNDEFEADQMAVVIAARSGYSPYGLVGALQTLGAIPTTSRTDLIYRTHPSPEDRLARLDAAMGTKLDGIAGKDDLPSFVALRDPPPPPPPAARPARPGPRKGRKG